MHNSSNGTISQFELLAMACAEKQLCNSNTSTMSNVASVASLTNEDVNQC